LVEDGRFGELFVLFIINILLGVITLGIYRFWGKTRIRKYIWSRSSFRGEHFEYSGTGGELFVTTGPALENVAARAIVDELRHQYVMAFAASPEPGWHGVIVKTKDRDLTVRARRGYAAGTRAGSKTL